MEEAWKFYLNKVAFENVFQRLQVVLRCILDDNGANNLVKKKRKLFCNATIVNLTNDNSDKDNIINIDNFEEDEENEFLND